MAADQLGVGESSRPVVDGESVSLELMGAAADSFVELLRDRLHNGTLHPGIPALGRVTMVGVGTRSAASRSSRSRPRTSATTGSAASA